MWMYYQINWCLIYTEHFQLKRKIIRKVRFHSNKTFSHLNEIFNVYCSFSKPVVNRPQDHFAFSDIFFGGGGGGVIGGGGILYMER